MIWSFKRKRNHDGTFHKYKDRICCHGGQQQWGVNYWDTYAPVVSWSSVWILLTLAKSHNLHTKSVDFVQAYPQAEVKHSIFFKPPAGVVLNDKNGQLVLKLLNSLYGLKDAGRTWFEHLSDGLLRMGFIATSSDPWIFNTNIPQLQYNQNIPYVSSSICSQVYTNTKVRTKMQWYWCQYTGVRMSDSTLPSTYMGMSMDPSLWYYLRWGVYYSPLWSNYDLIRY